VAIETSITLEFGITRTIKETKKKPQASLVVSSAMDLHLKLVNDGYATKPTSLSFTDRPCLKILNGEPAVSHFA